MDIKINDKNGITLKTKDKYCTEDIVITLGEIQSGVDTSDATATANDIRVGATAYVNDEKVTGTIEDYNGTFEGGAENQNDTLKKLLDFTKSASYLFSENTNVTYLTDMISYNSTENVTDMSNMFYGCDSLKTIPPLDTSKVTNMSSMFEGCLRLPTIPLLNTSNVTDMSGMFKECDYELTTIPPLDTSKVTNMDSMFYGCSKLTTIPQLDTSNVTNIRYAFSRCSGLTAVPQLNTSNVANMSSIFRECSDLIMVPPLDTSKVTNMDSMFYGCSKLTSIPQLNTSNVTNMSMMFYNCKLLTAVPQLNTSNVANMSSIFRECNKLQKIDITHYKAVNSYYSIGCSNCYSLKTIIIRSFGEKYILDSSAFSNCYHLLGTVNSTYNPNGDKDCYIYVPRSMVYTLKSATNWSTYADNICAIYNVSKLGNGNITENINSNGETIINAQEENSNFTGWYKGVLIEKYIPIEQIASSYETLNVTHPFTLNDNGYYQNSNQKVSSSFSIGRFKFNIENENQKLRITYLQSSESGYDYGVIGNVDTELPQDTTTTGYKNLKSITVTTPKEIFIDGINVGEHFIDIKYIKDSSGDNGTDTLQVKVEVVTIDTIGVIMNQELYSTEKEVNLGVIEEQTMEPLNLVAVFEDIN